MMKKIVKYSLGLLGLLVLTLLLVPFFLNVEDYRQQIEQQVEDATGRKLQMGQLKSSLFPWVGITLDDVVLANRSGFSDHAFLQVKHLDVQVALLPLLRQSVEIKRFVLQSPEIFLEKNAMGQGNWEDLLPAPAAVSPEGGSTSGVASQQPVAQTEKQSPILAALSADAMVLKDGELIWRDAQSGQDIALTSVQVQLDDVQLQRPIQAHISAKLNQDQISLDAQIGPVGDLNALDVNHLPVQLHVQTFGLQLAAWKKQLPPLPELLGTLDQSKIRFDVQVEQRPDGVRLLAGQAELLARIRLGLDWKVEMPNLNGFDVRALALSVNDQSMVTLQGEVKRLNQTPQYQMRIQSSELSRTWLSTWLPAVQEMYAGHSKPWETMKLGASLAGTVSRVELRDMQLVLDGELVQLSGDIDVAKAPDIRLRLAAKSLHLDPWLPKSQESSSASLEPYSQADAESATSAVEPDLRFLKDWRVSLQMQVENLLVQGLDVGHLKTVLNGGKGVFKLDPLQFELSGGQVREVASLNVNTYPVQWNESMSVTDLQLKPLLVVLAESDMLDGTMRLNTSLNGVGVLPESIKHTLQGSGQLSLLNGRIKGFDIAGGVRNFTHAGQTGETQYTDFAQLQGSFNIRDGLVKNNDLFMASPLFRLSGRGEVSLPDSTMDYHVRPKLIGSLVGQGDTSNRNGLVVPLHIYGPFTGLNVKPEITTENVVQEASKLVDKVPQLSEALKKVPAQEMIDPKLNEEQKTKVNQAIKGLLGL